MLGRRFMRATILLAAACALATGCSRHVPRTPQPVTDAVLGALTPAALRQTYRTPAFVVRRIDGQAHAAVQDADLPGESRIDDANLLIFAEGAGDTVKGFRATARLLAESPYAFPSAGDRLVIVLLRWSESTSAVAEHMNHKAQQAAAAVLAEMLEVHRRRHGPRGRVSLVGFSAGTRVIEMAYRGAASGDEAWHPAALARVANVVFLGSSLGAEESMPFASLQGRFINFVNPRDTHFGDRAAYVAPAGGAADLLKLLKQGTIERQPRFGASVAGFLDLATLTSAEQFDAVATLERSGSLTASPGAFRQVNVLVPKALVAFNVFGKAIPNDDLDDYLNLAPNHYILVGRGASGRTDLPDFRQYRVTAEEFVREQVASAALEGRIHRFTLTSVAKGADPLGLPLPVPWAVFAKPQKPAEAPPKPAAPDAPPPEE